MEKRQDQEFARYQCGSRAENEMDIHYKETKCKKCGKKIWFRVNFNGSGHDKMSFSELEQKMF